MAQMNLNQMRQLAWNLGVRNGTDYLMFTPYVIDISITAAINDFCDRTKFTKRTDPITLTANTMTLPAFPTGFVPGRLLDAIMTSSNVQTFPPCFGPWMSYQTVGAPVVDPTYGYAVQNLNAELTQCDYATVVNLRQSVAQQGQPGLIAFDTASTGVVYPQPTENYTLTLTWFEPMTVFTPGTQGTWSATKTYYPNDAVTGSSAATFICTAPPTAPQNINFYPEGNPLYWTAATLTVVDPSTITAPSTLPDNILSAIIAYGVSKYAEPPGNPDKQKQFDQLVLDYKYLGSDGTNSVTRNRGFLGGGY